MTDLRQSVPIALTPEGNRIVTKWLDKHGGSKTRLLERILHFFAGSPEFLQYILAGQVPVEMRADYAKKAVEFFADVVRSPDRWPEIPQSTLTAVPVVQSEMTGPKGMPADGQKKTTDKEQQSPAQAPKKRKSA